MKTLLPLVATALLAAPAFSQSVGEKATAPEVFKVGAEVDAKIALNDLTGKTHTFKDFRGKVVVIAFWSKDCPYMVPAAPKIQALADQYKGKDVVVIGINSNVGDIGTEVPKDAEQAKEIYSKVVEDNKKKKVSITILADHNNVIADRFAAKTTPHCYVIDQKGILQYSGALDDDPRGKKGKEATNYLSTAVDSLLAGEKVAVQSTKPYG